MKPSKQDSMKEGYKKGKQTKKPVTKMSMRASMKTMPNKKTC